MEILVRAGAMKGIVGAAALGRLDVVKKEADTSKSELESALLWACEYARASVVEFLLQRGVDVEVQGENRMTPIHLAALSGSLETVQLLIERGASLEVRNTWGGTVLNSALYGAMNWDPNVDYVPVVEALLKHGAEVRPGFPEWWAQQETLIPSAKDRIAELLNRHRKADA